MTHSMKIKPCPFCGKSYRGKQITTAGSAARFECERCGALGPFPKWYVGKWKPQPIGKPQAFYDELTLSAWNRREPETAVILKGKDGAAN